MSKKSFRAISWLLAIALFISLIPSTLITTVFAVDDGLTLTIKSNIPGIDLQYSLGSIDKESDLIGFEDYDGARPDENGTLVLPLHDGEAKFWLQPYYTDGGEYNDTNLKYATDATFVGIRMTVGDKVLETSPDKTYMYELEEDGLTDFSDKFGDSFTDLDGMGMNRFGYEGDYGDYIDLALWAKFTDSVVIEFLFERPDTGKTLTVKDDENGTFLGSEFVRKTDDGKGDIYRVYTRPDDNYQLLSYTVTGGETVQLDLKGSNYSRWEFDEPDAFGHTSLSCNRFEVAIEGDTEITLHYGPAEMLFEVVGYNPDRVALQVYTLFLRYQDVDGAIEAQGIRPVPLVANSGAEIWYTFRFKGFVPVEDSDVSNDNRIESFKVYSGTEKNDDALLFDINAKESVSNLRGTIASSSSDYVNEKWTSPHVYGGMWQNMGRLAIIKVPDTKQITTEMVAYSGRTFTITTDIEMASDVAELKEFSDYYTEKYGLDKRGLEAYTDAEKQTEGYQLYCQYSTFRYVMRIVYMEQLQLISQADDPAAALVTAKAALDAAARGEGCNAVSWSFADNAAYGTHGKPTLVAIPNDGDNYAKVGTAASNAIQAALEAEYPGNWSYKVTGTQFGAFVNSITAGGEDDTGSMHVRSFDGNLGGSYGMWYYNGQFSNYGVSNYYPYDGDVMAWGNPDVDRTWALAILRYHYKNIGGDAKLEQDMAERGVSLTSSGEELQKAFPEYNFSRYGQFRDTEPYEEVIRLIDAIGDVSLDSGDAIKAARDAYNELAADKQKRVYNYSALVSAETAFAKLSEQVDVTYAEALASTLAELNREKNVYTGSVKGEWKVLALARGGITSGTDTDPMSAAVGYQNSLAQALQRGKLTATTDYARAVLAMTSLGLDAPKATLDAVRDYDKAAAQGINAVTYALIALDSKPYDSGDTTLRDKYVTFLLNNSCDKGGWVYGGDTSAAADVDMTAMVIQALAPYYSTDTRVKDAVDRGLAVLKSRQERTGGFSSSGSYNAESTAQVIVALTALGIDPTKWTKADPIDALLHFYNSKSGMFRHSVNGADDQMATEQSAYALVAYRRFVMNQNRLYDMSDAFGDDSGVTDAQQAVSDAKMEISSLGIPNIPMTIANTAEEVKNYFTDTWLKMVTTKGPTYEVSIVEGEISAGGFYPAQVGTEAAPNGVYGRYIAYVTITMGEVSDTVRISGSIVPTAYVAPKEDITVSFELLGDMHHTITDDSDIHSYRFNADELPVWIKTVDVTVPGGSTVGDVFKKVMDERGFTYEGLAQGYISSIDNPNDAEKALTEKADSRTDAGWMYLVNGIHPSINLNGYELKGGEVITWHWTDDYRIEEGSEHWSASRVTQYIENLIKLIGEVDASDACKARIDQARSAYDKLNEEEQSRISNYQTLVDAEEKYLNLAGLDAIVPLVKDKTWTISMNDANDAAAVKTWLETKLNAMDLKGAEATVTITELTSATAGLVGKGGADGSFTFTIVLTIGEGDAMDSRILTGQTGTITAITALPDDVGIASVFVDGKPGTLESNVITVKLDYAVDGEGNLQPVPALPTIDITPSDPKATVSDLNSADEGVTWTFTITSQAGTPMPYTINVSRAASALEAKQAAVDAAKSMLDNADFSETLKGITDEAAAKAAVEAQIGALLKDAVSYTVSNISFTPASDGKTGEFTFTVDLTVGEEGSADAATGTSKQDGTIEATEHVASTNAGVTAIKVADVDAKILGNSFTVTVPYGTKVTASLFEITLADSKATYTTPVEENGVWSFTVTAEDGSTTATYTVTVTIGKNPDQVKADEVIGLIDNIGTVTLDSKAKIDAAREAYEGLTEAQKELVKNYQTLEKAEARYAELLNDENAAKNVIDLINDIGTVTTDSKAKIDAAREAYSKLTEAQKNLVTNYQTLEKAEADYAKLVADKADQDAADAVIDLINGIGTVTKDSKAKIDAARKAYDKLTEIQKKLVSNYQVLEKAEEDYAKLTDPNPPTPPSRDTYTLTFDTNGGSALKSVDAKAGTTIDLAQYVPVRAGYTFLGWYSDSALKNAVTSITLNRNTTVYAKWDKQKTPSVKNPFTDVKPGDWFYDDVMFVYEKKLMMGTSSTLFSPNEAATRAMLATILWRMEGSPAPKSSAGYSDVPTGQWYSDAIAWATEKGIFEGYGNGTFGPNDPITREQLAAIFYRYASHKGYDTSAVGSLEQFSDKDKASSWALDALKWAIGSGLMNGKGDTLDPTGTATRAEIAAMLHRFVDKYGLVPSTTPSGNTQWTMRSPRTYDSSALGTWNFMLCASAAALLALITAEKRRRQVNYAR